MTQKILQFLGFKQKKQSISDFLHSASDAEKLEFLGQVVQQVNEDQRAVIEKSKQIKSSRA